MSLSRKIAVTAGSLMLAGSFSASAVEQIFVQSFENGLGGGAGAQAASINERIFIDADSNGNLEGGVETRLVTCGTGNGQDCAFSVDRTFAMDGSNNPAGGNSVYNWNVHDGSTNPYAGGNKSTGNHKKYSPGMSGQVMGHVKANYNNGEDNYYQIDNIDLSKFKDTQLMFDFDSWIAPDGWDGFAVAINNNDGGGWSLLTPNAPVLTEFNGTGDFFLDGMEYVDLRCDSDLAALTGQSCANGGTVQGFNGFDGIWGNGIDMAGTAMFDIASMGDNVSLRFAFVSEGDSTNVEEGINIDNIKLTGVCKNGDGPNCDSGTPGNSLPAPATLALAAFGVMAVRRRRRA